MRELDEVSALVPHLPGRGAARLPASALAPQIDVGDVVHARKALEQLVQLRHVDRARERPARPVGPAVQPVEEARQLGDDARLHGLLGNVPPARDEDLRLDGSVERADDVVARGDDPALVQVVPDVLPQGLEENRLLGRRPHGDDDDAHVPRAILEAGRLAARAEVAARDAARTRHERRRLHRERFVVLARHRLVAGAQRAERRGHVLVAVRARLPFGPVQKPEEADDVPVGNLVRAEHEHLREPREELEERDAGVTLVVVRPLRRVGRDQ